MNWTMPLQPVRPSCPRRRTRDITELIRGKTARVYGDLQTLLTMMKGLPLAYNKDMQEDKEAIFDAVDNVKLCLETFTPMLETMRVLKDNMRAAAAKGFINATDCADYLVKKGMPFRDAYKISGTLVAECISKGLTLETLPLEEYQKMTPLFTEDVYDAISWRPACVAEFLRAVRPEGCGRTAETGQGKTGAGMKKRQMKFILALCSAAVAVWIGGEILLGLVLDLGLTVSRIWAIA